MHMGFLFATNMSKYVLSAGLDVGHIRPLGILGDFDQYCNCAVQIRNSTHAILLTAVTEKNVNGLQTC